MNIYLDIDGTLVNKEMRPAINLYEFIEKALGVGDVYWLTTHCKENDLHGAIEYLARCVSADTLALLSNIKPTHWDTLKTEAIDMSQEFLWFDDYLLEVEKKFLRERRLFDRWVEVNLNSDPLLDLHYFD